MKRPDRLLLYFGHHKCASTWIHSIVDAACVDSGWRLAYLYDEEFFGGDLDAYVAEHDLDFVSYVNANARFVRNLRPYRGFHVVRDPRDILVSAYFSHKKTHPTKDWPELGTHRDKLNKLGQDEGLFEEMEFNREIFEEMFDWDYHQEHVLELKQEELTVDPYRQFLAIFGFLGVLDESHFGKRRQLPYLLRTCQNVLYKQRRFPARHAYDSIPAERLLGIVHDNRFSNYAGGRKQGEENASSHYRKGVAGDWKNHFKPEHVERFKQLYGEVLLKLGYEKTPDWSATGQAARQPSQ
jgi:hypothetical protein